MKLDPYLDFNYLKRNYNKLSKPSGKLAIITGGSGRIGSVFSSLFLMNGVDVLVVSRSKEKFELFKKTLPKKIQKKIYWDYVDLSKPETIDYFWKNLKNKKIDYLVNNAASHMRGKFIKYNKKELTDEFFGIIGSAILLTEKVLPFMRKNKQGKIINVGSIWGVSAPKFSTYLDMDISPSLMTSVCKSGVMHMSKYLAARESAYGITINNLSPGWFPRKGKKSRHDYMKMINADIPLKRIGKLEDLVSAVNFLISSGSNYFTGQTIKVDGGHSIW